MQVAVGGSVGSELSEPSTESSEVIGLVAAMIILAFTFGTLVAMGLPIVSAVCGLAAGLSLIVLLGHVVTVPSIAPTLATMIGLGVGIDYALFLVSRHRANRAQGLPLDESIALAVATSGTAIVFAGTTVVIALLTLAVAGIPLVTALGYSSAVAVATAVLAAITLLPAVLALLGAHIEALRLPAFLRPKAKDLESGSGAAGRGT
jgi:RND superfamily putative drug exporter